MDDQTRDLLGKLLVTSYSLLDTSHKLQSPESLPVPATQENTVEIARKTLRFLRNLQDLPQDMENWLNIGELPEQQNKAELLEKLINLYAGQIKIAQLSNPDLLNHFTIDHANHAAGSLALSITLHTLEKLPEDSPSSAPLDSELDDILPEWDNRQTQSVEQLIDALESGLTHLLNKPLGDRSPIDRLVEVSNNLQEAMRQLYSIDTLEEPAREESIELAREILRRLKNMTFSDKDIEDAIDTGKPNEKLAFAKRIAEMLNVYKNLLSEATKTNPNIINDIRVKNASDAANDCANGIKLMAAKEIPTAASSLMQISADAEQVEGKKFQSTSLNRLMHKMEGGVEKAHEEIESHKKHEHKEETDAALTAQSEKLRRRRRSKHQNIAVNKSAHKAYTSLQHSQMLVNIQDRHKGVGGLNKLDIAAVRQAGSSLRNSNKQAHDMIALNNKIVKDAKTMGAANVSITSPFSPDDKSFAERTRDLNNPNNPNNPNHPRNRPRIG